MSPPHIRQPPHSFSETPVSYFPFFYIFFGLFTSSHKSLRSAYISQYYFSPLSVVANNFHYSIVDFFLLSPHFGVGCTQRTLYLDY